MLTMNVYDREFFRAEVQDDPRRESQAKLRSHGLIRKARRYFEERVEDESERLGRGRVAFDRNVRIQRVLCDHMSVVSVTSTDEDNAAAAFETLNDRGIGLSTPDLLRNFLLRRAPDDVTRSRIVEAWQTVLDMGDEANIDEFIRHYWVSVRGDVKARKLYREMKAVILAENIESLKLSLDLAEAASLYRDIVRARENDADLRRRLEGVRALGAKSLYPLLLSGYVAEDSDGPKSWVSVSL